MAVLPKMMYNGTRVNHIIMSGSEVYDCVMPDGTTIYHKHKGTSSADGGCFTVPVNCGGRIIEYPNTRSCGGLFTYTGLREGDNRRLFTCQRCSSVYIAGAYPSESQVTTDYILANQRCAVLNNSSYICNTCNKSYSATGTCTNITSWTTSCGFDPE